MKKYGLKPYTFEGRLADIQSNLAEVALSDEWGSKRTCLGCMFILLGLVGGWIGLTSVKNVDSLTTPITVAALLAIGVGALMAFHYMHYDTEDRRYQLPAQLLAELADSLDCDKEIVLSVDFRSSDNFCKPERDDTPPGWFQNEVTVRDFLQPWLKLTMLARTGQQLTLQIERSGEIRRVRKSKSSTITTRYQDFASLSVEDHSRAQEEPRSLYFPNHERFATLKATSTGQRVSIEAVGRGLGDGSHERNFEGPDLAALFTHALSVLAKKGKP